MKDVLDTRVGDLTAIDDPRGPYRLAPWRFRMGTQVIVIEDSGHDRKYMYDPRDLTAGEWKHVIFMTGKLLKEIGLTRARVAKHASRCRRVYKRRNDQNETTIDNILGYVDPH